MAPTPNSRSRASNQIEILIGRSLAVSVHPALAWKRLTPSKRALMVFGYFAVSYVTVFGALNLL